MIEFVSTDKAPGAIGPYSQATRAGGFVFCSGQVALDPASGEMIGETVEEQTRQALTNLSAVLAEAGCSLKDVVKTTVFLRDMADFEAMNGVYEHMMGHHRPARAAVAAAGLPKNALVEIEAIAALRP